MIWLTRLDSKEPVLDDEQQRLRPFLKLLPPLLWCRPLLCHLCRPAFHSCCAPSCSWWGPTIQSGPWGPMLWNQVRKSSGSNSHTSMMKLTFVEIGENLSRGTWWSGSPSVGRAEDGGNLERHAGGSSVEQQSNGRKWWHLRLEVALWAW